MSYSRGAVYEVVHAETGEVLSRHRTRQAAIDEWRLRHTGKPCEVWRRMVTAGDILIVKGTWYEATRAW